MVNSWGSELSSPHAVALSRGGEAVYVAEIGPNGIRKFEVVTPAAEMFWETKIDDCQLVPLLTFCNKTLENWNKFKFLQTLLRDCTQYDGDWIYIYI